MKTPRYLIPYALFGITALPVLYAAEPIEPIRPVQEINLAQVELGKNSISIRGYPSRALSPAIPVTI